MSSAIYPSLKNKHVAITGGASGIGEGIVRSFVEQGARVSFCDIQDDEAASLIRSLTHAQHTPAYHHCDLTDLAQVESFFREIGSVDILVNNAANDDRHGLDDITAAYWEDRVAINLRHLLFAVKAVVPAMKSQRSGAIINLGSISWHLGLKDLVLYETCKAGIEGMTRALARELGEYNIRVTCVIPGNVRTPRQLKWYTPEGEREIVNAQALKGRLAPSDVASLVMFLASDDARLCTGHGYWIDAGWR